MPRGSGGVRQVHGALCWRTATLRLLLRRPMVALGQLAIMIIAVGLSYLTADLVLVLAGGCLAYLSIVNGRSLERAVEESYIEK